MMHWLRRLLRWLWRWWRYYRHDDLIRVKKEWLKGDNGG